MRFRFIHEHQRHWPTGVMCRLLKVSRSGYYAWRRRPLSQRQRQSKALLVEVRRVHEASRGIYGSPRVHRQLLAQGISCCVNTVAKLMRDGGIRSKLRRRFVIHTTDSRHAHPIAPNHLERQFEQEQPDQAWCSDLTYIPTDEGWLYLAVVLDLCSRKVVGWAMADHLRSELVEAALKMALGQRRPAPGLIHHSDRGVQYACEDYQRLLEQQGMIVSMSRRGDCYDNAVAERFMGSLKTEWTCHQQYQTQEQARGSIFEYIEVFYNRQRLHSSLGYQSPEAYEQSLT